VDLSPIHYLLFLFDKYNIKGCTELFAEKEVSAIAKIFTHRPFYHQWGSQHFESSARPQLSSDELSSQFTLIYTDHTLAYKFRCTTHSRITGISQSQSKMDMS
jgi:hypothetical protein